MSKLVSQVSVKGLRKHSPERFVTDEANAASVVAAALETSAAYHAAAAAHDRAASYHGLGTQGQRKFVEAHMAMRDVHAARAK